MNAGGLVSGFRWRRVAKQRESDMTHQTTKALLRISLVLYLVLYLTLAGLGVTVVLSWGYSWLQVALLVLVGGAMGAPLLLFLGLDRRHSRVAFVALSTVAWAVVVGWLAHPAGEIATICMLLAFGGAVSVRLLALSGARRLPPCQVEPRR